MTLEGTKIGEMDCLYSYWVTDRPGSFTDDDIDRLMGLAPSLALAVKTASLTRIPVSVGRYALRGVQRPQELFTLDREMELLGG